MSELDGKVAVVTGATTGIGKEIARNLARAGATVVLPCRALPRGEAARADIERTVPAAKVELELADVSSQASLRDLAKRVVARHPKVDALVNNAAVWANERAVSKDGIELTWATNVLGYHLLTALLAPALVVGRGRIVNVASSLAHGLDLADPQFEKRPYSGMDAYAQSKQANRMLTWELAARLAGKVTANAVHPGFVASELNREARGLMGLAIWIGHRLVARSPRKGAAGATWLASAADAATVTNRFLIDRKELACPFRDPAKLTGLFELCEKQTGSPWATT